MWSALMAFGTAPTIGDLSKLDLAFSPGMHALTDPMRPTVGSSGGSGLEGGPRRTTAGAHDGVTDMGPQVWQRESRRSVNSGLRPVDPCARGPERRRGNVMGDPNCPSWHAISAAKTDAEVQVFKRQLDTWFQGPPSCARLRGHATGCCNAFWHRGVA